MPAPSIPLHTRDPEVEVRAVDESQLGRVLLSILAATGTLALAALIGFVVLVILFKCGAASVISILFYRGVVLCGLAGLIMAGLIAGIGAYTGRATIRDAISAAALSFGLNLSFLVLAPVTIDRSVSVYMLGYIEAQQGRPLGAADIEAAFSAEYVGRMRAINRRLDEQVASGNVELTREGHYVISAGGSRFMQTARLVAWLFDTDTRLVVRTDAPR